VLFLQAQRLFQRKTIGSFISNPMSDSLIQFPAIVSRRVFGRHLFDAHDNFHGVSFVPLRRRL